MTFVRETEYLVLVPVLSTNYGLYETSDAVKFYPKGRRFMFAVNIPSAGISTPVLTSIQVIPKSRRRNVAAKLDMSVLIRYDNIDTEQYVGRLS